jgi:hypothetical protein
LQFVAPETWGVAALAAVFASPSELVMFQEWFCSRLVPGEWHDVPKQLDFEIMRLIPSVLFDSKLDVFGLHSLQPSKFEAFGRHGSQESSSICSSPSSRDWVHQVEHEMFPTISLVHPSSLLFKTNMTDTALQVQCAEWHESVLSVDGNLNCLLSLISVIFARNLAPQTTTFLQIAWISPFFGLSPHWLKEAHIGVICQQCTVGSVTWHHC